MPALAGHCIDRQARRSGRKRNSCIGRCPESHQISPRLIWRPILHLTWIAFGIWRLLSHRESKRPERTQRHGATLHPPALPTCMTRPPTVAANSQGAPLRLSHRPAGIALAAALQDALWLSRWQGLACASQACKSNTTHRAPCTRLLNRQLTTGLAPCPGCACARM